MIDTELQNKDTKEKEFYNRNSEKWDYYSGLPSTLSYANYD